MDLDRAAPEIESALQWYNEQRIPVYADSLRGRRLVHLIGAAVTAAVVMTAIGLVGFDKGVIVILILPLMIVYGIWRAMYERAVRPTKELARKIRSRLQPLMFDFVDTLMDPATQAAFQPEKLLPRAAVGNFDTCDVKVIVSGRHKGVGFQICRAKLDNNAGENFETIFAGTILAVQLNEPFDGTLVLVHEHDLARSFWTWMSFRALDIGLPNPDCKVHSSNRGALTSSLLTQLCDELERLYRKDGRLGVPPRIAINRGWGFVLVPDEAGLRVDLPDTLVPMDLERDVKPVSANVSLLLKSVQPLCHATIAA